MLVLADLCPRFHRSHSIPCPILCRLRSKLCPNFGRSRARLCPNSFAPCPFPNLAGTLTPYTPPRPVSQLLPGQRHRYYFSGVNGCAHLHAAVVSRIPFRVPTCVAQIVVCLRQQVALNTLLSSCLRRRRRQRRVSTETPGGEASASTGLFFFFF